MLLIPRSLRQAPAMSMLSSPSTVGSAYWQLPASARKVARALFDQQGWCWGCDIRRPQGNLLVQYGFLRRPSADSQERSAYTLVLSDTCHLSLWGWGALYACEGLGSVLVRRHAFEPLYAQQVLLMPNIWSVTEAPQWTSPTRFDDWQAAKTLLIALIQRIAHYEAWLESYIPLSYRQACIEAGPEYRKYRHLLNASQAELWHKLAEICQTTPIICKG